MKLSDSGDLLSHLYHQDAVILRRLRIGDVCLLTLEQCPSCNCVLTLIHTLLECQQYISVRWRYFSDTLESRDILSFKRYSFVPLIFSFVL